MRNGARQSGGRGGVDAVMDVLLDVALLDGGDQGTGARPPIEPFPEPDSCERITLIEFLWTGSAGFQPVILVTREWLQ